MLFPATQEYGKSTLINGLFGRNITEEGKVSQKIKRGKNTTTAIQLYELEEDTYIADTPGFSTFDIYEIPSDELAQYYIDFTPYISNCEFIGCQHIKERKCGIKEAVEEGKIAKERYERYQKIYEDLKEREAHQW
ncbi:MAG: ribosome small subunit-dependent GTPase A [Clostridia bacterium]